MRSKLLLLSAVAALAATSASAADVVKGKKKAAPAPVVVVSPWEWTVGGGLTTNYVFRGITQSDNKASVNANAEIRYNFNDTFTGYLGTAGSSVKLTAGDIYASPSLEWDVMGGVRGTFGAFGVDAGAVGYIYPSFTTDAGGPFPTNPTWWEGYVKTTYAINDMVTVGANGFVTPSYLNTGASAQYLAGTVAVKLPMDFAFSGELGRQFIGTTDGAHGKVNLPDYTYWNAGLAYSYKIATLDLRYHDSNLSKAQCSALTWSTTSKYCNAAYVATLSFALTNKDVK